MNLKEAIKNLTDEELGELLDLIVNRQLEKAKEEEETPLPLLHLQRRMVFRLLGKKQRGSGAVHERSPYGGF